MSKIREINSSRTYITGSRWKSNHCGWFRIIGQSDRKTFKYTEKGTLSTCYTYFFCQFEYTNTIVEYQNNGIRLGRLKTLIYLHYVV